MNTKAEKDYYQPVLDRLKILLKEKMSNFHLEITAEGFSRKLKAEVREDIIWHFLQKREARPDITGFVKGQYWSDFIVVEVKIAILISPQPIPGKIKQLEKARPSLLLTPSHLQTVVLARFDKDTNKFVEWYKENPFEKGFYWK